MFFNPLGWIALLGIPAVVALHFLRRRFRPRVVSALFLWQTRDRSPTAGPTREKIRNQLSLWLECLAALGLALLIGGVKGCGAGEAEHLVLVLDGSASIATRDTIGDLRDDVIDEATRRIDALARGARVTLLQSGAPPEILAGPAALRSEAIDGLARFNPHLARHDFTPSLDLARQIAGEHGITFLTDHLPDDTPPDVEWIALGRPTANVAITHVARDSDATGDRATISVTSFAMQPRQVRLSLQVDRTELMARSLTLEPAVPSAITVTLPPGTPSLFATIDADALAIDNQAWLARPQPHPITIASDLSADTLVELGLQDRGERASPLERWRRICEPAHVALSIANANLTLSGPQVDRTMPVGTVDLRIDAPGAARRDLVGPFLIEKQHPLLRGVTLEGVVWSTNDQFFVDGAPLISAGNIPLLSESFDDGMRRLRMNYDPTRSTLHRSPDWPILLANLSSLARAERVGPARTQVTVGEALSCRAPHAGTVTVRGANYERDYPTRGILTLDSPSQPGIYQLSMDDESLGEIAVNFSDAAESNLLDAATGRQLSDAPLPVIEASLVDIDLAILALLIAILLADWFVLRRMGGT